MGEFGLLGPGNEVLAPEEGGEAAGKTGCEVGGGCADEIDQAQFGGEIGQKRSHPFAVARFEGGLGVGTDEVEFGVGDSAGDLLARGQGGDQMEVRRLGGLRIGGGSGGGKGEEDFGQRRRGPADVAGGPGGSGMAGQEGPGLEGAKDVAVDFAELRAQVFEGLGRHQEKTTVRFL